MTVKLKYYIALVVLLAGCGDAKFSKLDKPTKSAEDSILEGVKKTAASAYQCKEQRLALIHENEGLVRSLITQFKNTLPKNDGNVPKIDLKPLAEQYYERAPDADLVDDICGILTSQGFKTVLQETAELIEQVANNNNVMANIMGIHNSLGKKPGDKIAEMVSMLAEDASKRDMLFGVAKTALCESASNENIVDALMSYSVLLELGQNALFLIGSPVKKHAKSLYNTKIAIPENLKKFVMLAQGIAPKQDFCSMENLDAYQKHFQLAATLLKAPENPEQPRPLRTLLNTTMRLYTMADTNECKGLSYDSIQQEDLQETLFRLARIVRKSLL